MAQVINTNVAALFAGAALNKSAIALQTAQQRLSSGVRINSAKDDATGLVNATNTDALIRAANVSIRTENDTISDLQTQDGYLAIVTDNLLRIAEVGASSTEGTALTTENTNILKLVTAAPAQNLSAVGAARATLGGGMAVAASKVATQQVLSVNLSAKYSRIMDTDYAVESTNMARANILQQAGTAALAQANQTPNTVLTLLR
ncbi:MAG: flagellin [Gammaproteobacteria bacterium]|nr:flagellin [Gammaproteobacteria bacterium]MBU1979134.1 flagellin [Gammaproteobacteria bacterium]